ncbi:MAG: membrane associated rhomboid family serine protease [Kiritimatiellia bacterium]|jgi:membrane associated rhomboid family serine protease
MVESKSKTVMRISYNAPVTLTFTLLCLAATVIGMVSRDTMNALFSVQSHMNMMNPISWLRLISHPIGHAGWEHVTGNLLFVLLLGPVLEEKYGSKRLLTMMLITALVTSVAVIFVFKINLVGASGIVFMLILLSSLVNFKSGQIPLTFVLVAILFFGREVVSALKPDHVSQAAHIIGGVCGSLFGFSKKL